MKPILSSAAWSCLWLAIAASCAHGDGGAFAPTDDSESNSVRADVGIPDGDTDTDIDFSRTGARKLPEEIYLKIQQAKMARNFASADAALFSNLPARTDLSEELPEPGEQGEQGSCAGWAVGYAVKSFQENREHGWGLTPDHLFSPAFLYNQVNAGIDEGAYMTDVMALLEKSGTAPLSMMPYVERDFTTQPCDEIKNLARSFRSLGYRRIDDHNVDTVKAYLAAGDPVVLELALYGNFSARGMRKSGNMYRSAEGDNLGYHFLVAVGYDDAKSAVRILNSWGKRWGENGLAWIAYDFFPNVVERAYVIYDLPTPEPAVALLWPSRQGDVTSDPSPRLANDASAPGPAAMVTNVAQAVPINDPQIKASAYAKGDETLIIVPEEAGISYSGKWLRLNEAYTAGREFFSEKTSPRFKDFDPNIDDVLLGAHHLFPDKLGQMHFLSDKRVPVYTNLGVTFHTPRSEVHRIYREPDHTDQEDLSDTYFYHAVATDWGGVSAVSHAALIFRYDEHDTVVHILMAMVHKESVTNTASVPVALPASNDGAVVTATEAGIRFTPPPQFSDVQKSVWPGVGLGFFLKNPSDPDTILTVKIFDTPGKGEDVLKERMDADLKTQQATGDGNSPQTGNFGGIGWQIIEDLSMGHRRFYYGYKNGKVYQIYVFTGNSPASALAWVDEFLGSVTVGDL